MPECKFMKSDEKTIVEHRGMHLQIPVKTKEDRYHCQAEAKIKGIAVEKGITSEMKLEKVLDLSRDRYGDLTQINVDEELLTVAARSTEGV